MELLSHFDPLQAAGNEFDSEKHSTFYYALGNWLNIGFTKRVMDISSGSKISCLNLNVFGWA
jgi:hypothetical protein